MDAFELLRLREPFPPSRSTFNRFLIKSALHRFREGFPETFVSAWADAGLPQWWGPEAASDAPVYTPGDTGSPPSGAPRQAGTAQPG